MDDRYKFGMYVIGIVTIIQGVAWVLGHNGKVFAFTSFIIGGIAGALLGFGGAKHPILSISGPKFGEKHT